MTPWALIRPARLAGSGLLRTQSDERLVDLVRAGNDRAFEAIVLRYHRPLLRHCRRLLPAGRAEDAVQQTLLRALEAIRADQRELQLGPWLHRIAHNAAIDSLRRLDAHWEELDEGMDGVEPTHAAVERRAQFHSVISEMGSLPERQRRALVLRELEGRSYEEIATALGVTGNGVRQLLNRARNAMRATASALVPPALVARLAGSQAGVRAAELADPPATTTLIAKTTAAVAAGAVALFAVSGSGDHVKSPRAHATPHPPALERGAGAPGQPAKGAAAARADVGERRSGSREASGRRSDGRGVERNAIVPGEVPAGQRLRKGDPPVARPQSDSIRAGRGGVAGDIGDEVDVAPGATGELDDDRASGDDAPDDDEVAVEDDGPEDDTPVAGSPPPDLESAAPDDDDASAPAVTQLAAGPVSADEDDDDDDAGEPAR